MAYNLRIFNEYHIVERKNSITEDEYMSVSWQAQHSYIEWNDLCRYEVSPKLLK